MLLALGPGFHAVLLGCCQVGSHVLVGVEKQVLQAASVPMAGNYETPEFSFDSFQGPDAFSRLPASDRVARSVGVYYGTGCSCQSECNEV